MKRKLIQKFTYEGFGFPVEIHSVEMVKIDDEWHPKLDIKKVATLVIEQLVLQKERLTGNQVKFIRTHLEMSLREFATRVVSESHTAVAKWEKVGNKTTSMDINIEKMLRLYVQDKLFTKTKKQQSEFYKKYLTLMETHLSSGINPHIKVDQSHQI